MYLFIQITKGVSMSDSQPRLGGASSSHIGETFFSFPVNFCSWLFKIKYEVFNVEWIGVPMGSWLVRGNRLALPGQGRVNNELALHQIGLLTIPHDLFVNSNARTRTSPTHAWIYKCTNVSKMILSRSPCVQMYLVFWYRENQKIVPHYEFRFFG